jgi:hemerythrin-like domain-containing protein
MADNITQALVHEHKLILRMLTLLEQRAPLTRSGEYTDYRFYLEGVDFIRNYADRFHHAKEEDVLFEALVQNGMPRANSPVAAMLVEHDRGRAYVAALEEAARSALAGRADRNGVIAENAIGYAALLREHIAKEDEILYPLAERVIPGNLCEAVLKGYADAARRTPADFERRYAETVARFEAEPLGEAA